MRRFVAILIAVAGLASAASAQQFDPFHEARIDDRRVIGRIGPLPAIPAAELVGPGRIAACIRANDGGCERLQVAAVHSGDEAAAEKGDPHRRRSDEAQRPKG